MPIRHICGRIPRVYDGFKLWIGQKNAEGGVFVKPYNRKVPIKLMSYDDQSSKATAATLYNQLITQDKVALMLAIGSRAGPMGTLHNSPPPPAPRSMLVWFQPTANRSFSAT